MEVAKLYFHYGVIYKIIITLISVLYFCIQSRMSEVQFVDINRKDPWKNEGFKPWKYGS